MIHLHSTDDNRPEDDLTIRLDAGLTRTELITTLTLMGAWPEVYVFEDHMKHRRIHISGLGSYRFFGTGWCQDFGWTGLRAPNWQDFSTVSLDSFYRFIITQDRS